MSKKYIELYRNSPSNGEGLILSLSIIPNIPWYGLSNDEARNLERNYYLRSGNKRVSSVFETISEEYRPQLISQMFAEKWTRLWEDYKTRYETLSPYNITETGNDSKIVDTDTITKHGKVVDETATDTGTVETESNSNGSDNQNIFGFNSTTAVGANSSTDTDKSDSKETRDLSATRKQTNSGEDVIDGSEIETGEHTITKKGNLGTHTPQKLIMENFELWKTPYFEKVFSDIDAYIMLQVYD